MCRLKIPASAVELGFEDDFWDGRDSVFINGLSVRSILFAQKMLASHVELCFEVEFWDTWDSFFVNGFCVRSSVFA